jgi:hypothetical protein
MSPKREVPALKARKAQGIARQHVTKELQKDPTKDIAALIKESIDG